jgi:hypothetical protein
MQHVDVTGGPSMVRRFTELAGDVRAHSIIDGASPVFDSERSRIILS